MRAFLRIEMWWIVFPVAVLTYFSFRYFALEHALRETDRELREIQANVLRNQILHLPLPDKGLEQLLKSINATLEQVRQERQAGERREREFQQQIEDISHDLRTPLTVILGYLKWLKAPAGEPSFQVAEALDVLERNARTMEHLVSQFYAFSCLNGPDFALELQDVDVCRLLKETLADNYRLLEKPDFRLDCCLPEHPVTIPGNKDACERIFANMLQNAGRYAHGYLTIRMEESCGQVRIFFQNDSEEIKESDISNLFNRFYVNNSSRSKGGSGLGLTIAKSLAEAMGGSLTAQALPRGETGHFSWEEALGHSETHAETAICFTLTLPATAT